MVSVILFFSVKIYINVANLNYFYITFFKLLQKHVE
jgi:hypothetical protein